MYAHIPVNVVMPDATDSHLRECAWMHNIHTCVHTYIYNMLHIHTYIYTYMVLQALMSISVDVCYRPAQGQFTVTTYIRIYIHTYIHSVQQPHRSLAIFPRM
jgi:hypothetical protein